jgi:hypothetical protein
MGSVIVSEASQGTVTVNAWPRRVRATIATIRWQALAAGISKSHSKSQRGQTLGNAHRH